MRIFFAAPAKIQTHETPEQLRNPFLVGLDIEPENPWATGGHRRRLKSKSVLTTLELCAGKPAARRLVWNAQGLNTLVL